MDQERIRLQGMLEVFQTIGNLGVNKIEKPAEEELNIVNTEEVIDGE